MTRTELLAHLRRLDACGDAQAWAAATRGRPSALWRDCPRGDWLLWLAARAGVDRRLVVLAACDCARLALPYATPGDDRPLRAIEAAEAWARGEATIAEVQTAASAASFASAAASAAYAASAASASAYCAAYYAAHAAYYAAHAAYYAAEASAFCGTAPASATLAQCADLVRARISLAVVARGLDGER